MDPVLSAALVVTAQELSDGSKASGFAATTLTSEATAELAP